MTSWVSQSTARTRMLIDQIALWHKKAVELGIDPEQACAPFYAMLDEVYFDDLPLARAKDNSDLLLHIEGKAVEGSLRISLVSHLFSNVQLQVRDLTKAIVGLLPDHRVKPREIDLGLSGLARGSLFIGFNVPTPRDEKGNGNLLGEHDPLFKATKDALRIINTVSHSIEMVDEQEATLHVASVVTDPKIRDAALVAVRRMSPTGRQGVSRIGVTSAETPSSALLTREVRAQLGRMLSRPVLAKESLQLDGTIREIDLDAKRFELRGITNQAFQDIRCVYTNVEHIKPQKLLDARVRVKGLVERRSDEVPRLMALETIEMLDEPNEPRLV